MKADDFRLFVLFCWPILLFIGLAVFLVIFFIPVAHADTNAEKVFGRWERVSIENIRQPVPEYTYAASPLGAVTNEYRHPVFKDRPAQPGGPNISPRSTAPQQVVGLQSNLPERR